MKTEHSATEATGVIWLASYPKSGNTWVREILAQIFAPEHESLRRGEAITTFQKEWPEEGPAYDIWRQKLRIIKTHLHPYNERMARCPLPSAGTITIRRHPLDVLLSALNYARVRQSEKAFRKGVIKPVEDIVADGDFPYYVEQFKEKDGFPWFTRPSAEFSEYMSRWRRFAADQPYHEICYEDLFAQPEAEIGRLLAFLGLDTTAIDPSQIYQDADQKTAKNGAFFWKRRAYNFEKILSQDLIDMFYSACANQLLAAGYSADQDKNEDQR